jgi:hypothetical protein
VSAVSDRKRVHAISIHMPGCPPSWAAGLPNNKLKTTTDRHGAYEYTPAAIPLVLRALRRIAPDFIITVH